ncbi:unnamed protein product [Ilex paraguariensis]|uniref:Uncharacterized protein n=1 Tax=Ilex paraguariensis TaxID=185542 RepID=A0ABC8T9T2_9AQUA
MAPQIVGSSSVTPPPPSQQAYPYPYLYQYANLLCTSEDVHTWNAAASSLHIEKVPFINLEHSSTVSSSSSSVVVVSQQELDADKDSTRLASSSSYDPCFEQGNDFPYISS